MTAAAAQRCDDVCAVVVTYNPAPDALGELLDGLCAQAGHVVVVDNGSTTGLAPAVARAAQPDGRLELLRNAANLGIAAAQNIGMGRALERPGCRFLLLSDDDSLPAPGMVAALRSAVHAAADPVAAAGPATTDLRSGQTAAYLVDAGGRRQRRTLPAAGAAALPAQPVGFLIASGSLIPVATLRAIGGMRSNYFIDHVDTEWCFRARAAGLRLLLVPQARLFHRLGDAVRRIWILRRREVAYHSPLRDYYMFRNTLLMQRDTPISVHWRYFQLLRLAQFAVYYLVLGDLRIQRFRLMWLGLRHGMNRVSGRLDLGTGDCEAIPLTPLDPVP